MRDKRFLLTGSAYFYAIDLQDAFEKLAAHFKAMADEQDEVELFFELPSELIILCVDEALGEGIGIDLEDADL